MKAEFGIWVSFVVRKLINLVFRSQLLLQYVPKMCFGIEQWGKFGRMLKNMMEKA
jgi:hypothetical protein